MASDKDQEILGKNAFELFPDILKNTSFPQKKSSLSSTRVDASPTRKSKATNIPLVPPQPPNLSKLLQGDSSLGHNIESPLALILMSDPTKQTQVAGKVKEIGYIVESAASENDAIEQLKLANLNLVILETGFAGKNISTSKFHHHMKSMPMVNRRYIFYAIIGPEFHSAYNIQALAASANLVINDAHIDKLPFILRKGFQDYEALFGPYIELLQLSGKK